MYVLLFLFHRFDCGFDSSKQNGYEYTFECRSTIAHIITVLMREKDTASEV